MKKICTNCGGNYEPIRKNRRRKIDELVMHMYDDIIPNDDRINILFNDGFDKIKIEQKRFLDYF